MTDILHSPSFAPVSVDKRSRWRPLAGQAPVVEGLPQAPTDDDKYAYFGRQHIWFITAHHRRLLGRDESRAVLRHDPAAVVVLADGDHLHRLHVPDPHRHDAAPAD